MVANRTLPRLIMLLAFLLFPVLVAPAGQNQTAEQEKEQQELKKQQEKEQQDLKKQQEKEKQDQLKQEQEQKKQEQLRQQQEQQEQQRLKQQQRQGQLKEQQDLQHQKQQEQSQGRRPQGQPQSKPPKEPAPSKEPQEEPQIIPTQEPRKLNPQQEQQEQQLKLERQHEQQQKFLQDMQRQEQLRQQQEKQQQEQAKPPGQHPSTPGEESHPNPGQRPNPIAATPKVLSAQESKQTIQYLNQNHDKLGGINVWPLPEGQVTSLPNGHHIIATHRGTEVEVRANGAVEGIKLANGKAATYHANGQLSSVHAPGIEIRHGLRGERTIVTENNGQRLVSLGPHRGYVERSYLHYNGREYMQRTYWEGGRPYARIFWDHAYHGRHYYQFEPPYFYREAFYRWAYERWVDSIRYRWAWWEDPWRYTYGTYFVPESMYPSAPWWITDFLIAENLKLAYQARLDADGRAASYQPEESAPAPGGDNSAVGQLTPEMKTAIQAEVEHQLEEERAEATQPAPSAPAPGVGAENPPAALDPAHRLFIVSSNLTVSTAEGRECELTGGDLITRIDDTPGDDGRVRVSVTSSKQQDCGMGSTTVLDVNDLEEMHNNFRAQVDAGLGQLSNNQGRGGIPLAPDPSTIPGAVPPPTPDGNVDAQLNGQQAQAEQAEREIQQEVQVAETPPSR